MIDVQQIHRDKSAQMGMLAHAIFALTRGKSADVAMIALINVLLNAALEDAGGDERDAEKRVRKLINLAIAGMHRDGGALQ